MVWQNGVLVSAWYNQLRTMAWMQSPGVKSRVHHGMNASSGVKSSTNSTSQSFSSYSLRTHTVLHTHTHTHTYIYMCVCVCYIYIDTHDVCIHRNHTMIRVYTHTHTIAHFNKCHHIDSDRYHIKRFHRTEWILVNCKFLKIRMCLWLHACVWRLGDAGPNHDW